MQLLPYGPLGWLVELPEADVIGYATAVRRRDDPAVVEIVPAARTVLVRIGDPRRLVDVGAWLATVAPEAVTAIDDAAVVEIRVVYDGEDLGDVAAATGLTPDEVVARHTAGSYRCAFCGFGPGFAYLLGLDPVLHLPRRSTPRTRVPSGAVAIAAGYSAAYPSPSPGGWHLLGSTDAPLWDVARDEPALIRPGTAVRFAAVGR